MKTSAYTRNLVVILAALALAACPGKKGKHNDDPEIYYVSAVGSDNNPGTQGSPFKTITHALRVATRSSSTVRVAPGTYNVAHGESFPITVPAGVLLIGDETNKGGGSTPTSIVGGGGQAPGATAGYGVALLTGAGSTIAGFTITNDNPALSGRFGLFLSNNSVTLRNNTVKGATHKAGVYVDASTNHMITGNRIVDNGGSSAGTGLAFGKGGVGSKVENNVISGNGFGVEYDVDGGDLGGGGVSAGGNVISCNTQNDLVSFAPTNIIINATGNFWDHSSPTRGPGTGDDIYVYSGMATVNADSAAQTSNPSPCAGVTLFVDVSTGSDANPGTQALPFKTITKAMTLATSGTTVQVAPGIYNNMDLNTPEVFPITVPDGVLLIGDETNKGGGSTPTTIYGGGLAPGSAPGMAGVALLPGTGSTIAGFTITNDDPSFANRRGVMLGNSSVTLRNNTVTGAVHAFGVYVDGSMNHVITGNRIVGNGGTSAGSGLAFVSGGVGSKVESNVITGNGIGVEYDVDGGDLGGGSASSAGANVLSCNAFVDLYVGVAATIFARNNLWDHVPQTLSCAFGNTGDDICDAGVAVDTTGGMVASSPCP